MEFLTRPQCHLCAEAAPVVARVAMLTGLAVVERNVDDDPVLAVDWGLRIPVVRGRRSGAVLAEGAIRFWPLLGAALRERLGG